MKAEGVTFGGFSCQTTRESLDLGFYQNRSAHMGTGQKAGKLELPAESGETEGIHFKHWKGVLETPPEHQAF